MLSEVNAVEHLKASTCIYVSSARSGVKALQSRNQVPQAILDMLAPVHMALYGTIGFAASCGIGKSIPTKVRVIATNRVAFGAPSGAMPLLLLARGDGLNGVKFRAVLVATHRRRLSHYSIVLGDFETKGFCPRLLWLQADFHITASKFLRQMAVAVGVVLCMATRRRETHGDIGGSMRTFVEYPGFDSYGDVLRPCMNTPRLRHNRVL